MSTGLCGQVRIIRLVLIFELLLVDPLEIGLSIHRGLSAVRKVNFLAILNMRETSIKYENILALKSFLRYQI